MQAGVIDAALRALPRRIPPEVPWRGVRAPPPEDAGSALLDCMRCAREAAPPLELPPDPPLLEGITRASLTEFDQSGRPRERPLAVWPGRQVSPRLRFRHIFA